MKMYSAIVALLISTSAFADDITDKDKHDICSRHPPIIVSRLTGELKWLEGFESCKDSERAWATSQAKKAEDEKADRDKLNRLNNPNLPVEKK